MGHVNPAVCQPRKESWRWETTNAEYGKFYVRRNQREILKSQEFQYDCSKKCEELSNELQEAKAQLEKLKISCVRSICGPGATLITLIKPLIKSLSHSSHILTLSKARRQLQARLSLLVILSSLYTHCFQPYVLKLCNQRTGIF